MALIGSAVGGFGCWAFFGLSTAQPPNCLTAQDTSTITAAFRIGIIYRRAYVRDW